MLGSAARAAKSRAESRRNRSRVRSRAYAKTRKRPRSPKTSVANYSNLPWKLPEDQRLMMVPRPLPVRQKPPEATSIPPGQLPNGTALVVTVSTTKTPADMSFAWTDTRDGVYEWDGPVMDLEMNRTLDRLLERRRSHQVRPGQWRTGCNSTVRDHDTSHTFDSCDSRAFASSKASLARIVRSAWSLTRSIRRTLSGVKDHSFFRRPNSRSTAPLPQ
jgi:hypothetical protein